MSSWYIASLTEHRDISFLPLLRIWGEIGWNGVDCIGLAQDRDRKRALGDAVANLQVT
jgi:hypothetical protein